jgi:hypothetical protein
MFTDEETIRENADWFRVALPGIGDRRRLDRQVHEARSYAEAVAAYRGWTAWRCAGACASGRARISR